MKGERAATNASNNLLTCCAWQCACSGHLSLQRPLKSSLKTSLLTRHQSPHGRTRPPPSGCACRYTGSARSHLPRWEGDHQQCQTHRHIAGSDARRTAQKLLAHSSRPTSHAAQSWVCTASACLRAPRWRPGAAAPQSAAEAASASALAPAACGGEGSRLMHTGCNRCIIRAAGQLCALSMDRRLSSRWYMMLMHLRCHTCLSAGSYSRAPGEHTQRYRLRSRASAQLQRAGRASDQLADSTAAMTSWGYNSTEERQPHSMWQALMPCCEHDHWPPQAPSHVGALGGIIHPALRQVLEHPAAWWGGDTGRGSASDRPAAVTRSISRRAHAKAQAATAPSRCRSRSSTCRSACSHTSTPLPLHPNFPARAPEGGGAAVLVFQQGGPLQLADGGGLQRRGGRNRSSVRRQRSICIGVCLVPTIHQSLFFAAAARSTIRQPS